MIYELNSITLLDQESLSQASSNLVINPYKLALHPTASTDNALLVKSIEAYYNSSAQYTEVDCQYKVDGCLQKYRPGKISEQLRPPIHQECQNAIYRPIYRPIPCRYIGRPVINVGNKLKYAL